MNWCVDVCGCVVCVSQEAVSNAVVYSGPLGHQLSLPWEPKWVSPGASPHWHQLCSDFPVLTHKNSGTSSAPGKLEQSDLFLRNPGPAPPPPRDPPLPWFPRPSRPRRSRSVRFPAQMSSSAEARIALSARINLKLRGRCSRSRGSATQIQVLWLVKVVEQWRISLPRTGSKKHKERALTNVTFVVICAGAKHQRHRPPTVCVQQFHREDSERSFFKWVCRFLLCTGQCTSEEFEQIIALKSQQSSKSIPFVFQFCLVHLTFDNLRCKSRELHGPIFYTATTSHALLFTKSGYGCFRPRIFVATRDAR